MAMRAQVSLTFTDSDVYEGLVKPMKDARELSSFIVGLVQSYYYSDEIRAIVDGSSLQTENEAEKSKEAYSNFREILETMDIIIEDAKNSMEEKQQSFFEIARAARTEMSNRRRSTEDRISDRLDYLTGVVENIQERMTSNVGFSVPDYNNVNQQSVSEEEIHKKPAESRMFIEEPVEDIPEHVSEPESEEEETEGVSAFGEAKNSIADLLASAMG